MTDATPERDEVERDELYLGDSWAALLIAEKTKTVQAERERDEAREALEKVRQDERERCAKVAEEWRDKADRRADLTGRLGRFESAQYHVAQAGAANAIAAAIRGDDA